MISINKKELGDRVAEKYRLPKKHSRLWVDAILKTMEDVLMEDESLILNDFGSIKVRKRGARRFKDPTTQEAYIVPPRRYVSFKLCQRIQDNMKELDARDLLIEQNTD